MLIYSTVSPYYFDYLASCRTRQEILDDPDLCHYLENPTLKDNMELALAYNDAKKGGYPEKKQFVEYLLCNGPELDADTICYYREKAYQDPIYIQIAEIEFSDMTLVDQLRVDKYGKSNDLGDCFTKPCNYLGPFANVIGMMGDSNNFRTMPNLFSTLLNGSEEDKKDLKACWGNIREHLMHKMLPNIQTACQVMYNGMYEHMKEFADECKNAGLTKGINIGDPYAIKRADDIAAMTKVNVHSKLGDCARVWEHMRRFNPYDISKNKKGPIPDSAKKDNKAMNGSSTDTTTHTTITSQLSPDKLREAAAKGNKMAEVERELQNLPWPLTLTDLEYVYSPDHTDKEKYDYIANKTDGANGVTAMNKWRAERDKLIEKYKDDRDILDYIDARADEYQTKVHDKVYKVWNTLVDKRQQAIEQLQKEAAENTPVQVNLGNPGERDTNLYSSNSSTNDSNITISLDNDGIPITSTGEYDPDMSDAVKQALENGFVDKNSGRKEADGGVYIPPPTKKVDLPFDNN